MSKKIVHEMWEEPNGNTGVCLAGPMGEDCRSLQDPNARLVWVFEAKSHFEAMTMYYTRMGWGEYQPERQWDIRPYPVEWIKTQAETAQEWKAFHKAKMCHG